MAYPCIIALTPQSKHHTTIGPVKLDKQFLAEKIMRAGGYYSLQLKTIIISWKPCTKIGWNLEGRAETNHPVQ